MNVPIGRKRRLSRFCLSGARERQPMAKSLCLAASGETCPGGHSSPQQECPNRRQQSRQSSTNRQRQCSSHLGVDGSKRQAP